MQKTQKIIGIILTLIMILSCLTGLEALAAEPKALPTEPGSVLTEGQYVVSESTEIIATEAGQSALVIADGETVEIFINRGVTLTVIGGDAEGRTGGGAGIFVPEGSTLYLSGRGSLFAQGGNAANGGNGENGQNGSSRIDDDDIAAGGKGGNGGYGGGGAGAGIGGIGGKGGAGGAGGAGGDVSDEDTYTIELGHEGIAAQDGQPGTTSGAIYISNISNSSKGGSTGNDGKNGKCGSCSYYEYGYFSDGSYGAGGGAGQGGQGGRNAFNVGHGGGGGGGGASGGGGAAACNLRQKILNPTVGGIGGYDDGDDLVFSTAIEFEVNYSTEVKGGLPGLGGISGYNLSYANNTYHHHFFSDEWTSDDQNHWHKCNYDNCFMEDYSSCLYNEAAFGTHIDADDDCFCDVCGRLDAEKKNLNDTKKAAIDRLFEKIGEEPSNECFAIVYNSVSQINAAETPDDVQTLYEKYLADVVAQLEAEEAMKAFAEAKVQAISEVTAAAGDEPSDTVLALIAEATASINAAEDYRALSEAKEHGIILVMSQLNFEASEASAEKLASIEDELADIKSALDEIKATLAQMSIILAEKQEELESKDEELTRMRAAILEKTAELASKDEELAAKEAERAKAVTAYRNAAVNELSVAVGDNASGNVKAAAYDARAAIEKASTVDEIKAAKEAGLKNIAQIKADEASVNPGEPEHPSVCGKCGRNHSDSFLGKILCFFYRILNLFA